MHYKLKDIFLESSSAEDNKIVQEGVISSLLSPLKDMVSNILSKGEIKNTDNVVKLLKRLKRFGLKRLGKTPIDVAIHELERYKKELLSGDTDERSEEQIFSLLKNLKKHQPKNLTTHNSQKNQIKSKSIGNKYKLNDIF